MQKAEKSDFRQGTERKGKGCSGCGEAEAKHQPKRKRGSWKEVFHSLLIVHLPVLLFALVLLGLPHFVALLELLLYY
jgi:hypothetical protein